MARTSPSLILAIMALSSAAAQQSTGLRPVFRGRSTDAGAAPAPQQLQADADADADQPAPVLVSRSPTARQLDCGGNSSSFAFELITGFAMGLDDDAQAPGQQLADPSVVLKEARLLKLSECLAKCRVDKDCKSVNFETGLCVLFRENADSKKVPLVESQSPVFTEYGQKVCLKEARACGKPWAWERVDNWGLNDGHSAKKIKAGSRSDCAELCLNERAFVCRSANYNPQSGECSLSLMSRYTLKGPSHFTPQPGMVYLENNCVDQAIRMCEFHKLPGRILKTVDSIYEDVGNVEECRELCLGDKERCNSYDYGDVGDKVCRLSHHTAATLTIVTDPYQAMETATTYEMSACYNIEIDCRAKDMVAKIRSTRVFDGKVYAKGNPVGCLSDIKNSLAFELKMPYDDSECNVVREEEGSFRNELIIQHHDKIVTQADLALSVRCRYDLANQTVSNNVSLEVESKIDTIAEEEAYVGSPDVYMAITDRNLSALAFARVGDPLTLIFGISNKDTPYDLFVRSLVAMDGADGDEITLIDEDGCPSDPEILGPIENDVRRRAHKKTDFEAFKFPRSDVVFFRATISFCVNGPCKPVDCRVSDFAGRTLEVDSYGRRRRRDVSGRRNRRHSTDSEEMMVVQSITISDRHAGKQPEKQQQQQLLPAFVPPFFPNAAVQPAQTTFVDADGVSVTSSSSSSSAGVHGGGYCVNMVGLVVACSLFLVAQLVVIVAWTYVWQKKRRSKLDDTPLPETTADSLTQLFHAGYPARRF